MNAHVLIVDDDFDLAEMLGLVLAAEGFQTTHAGDGNDAVAKFDSLQPDLVLLDVMLPGMDGIQVCRTIRETSGTPIIMLTARTDTQDVVAGLEAGADDYVMKPFNPTELLARVRARLRKIEGSNDSKLRIGDVCIDVSKHEVKRGDEVIQLTPLEFDLLELLARYPDQAFTRDALLEKVWGYQYKADNRLVNVHVQRLRAKIEVDPDNPTIVVTVRGVGYRAGSGK
ncbi:MtrAB system response regulator MtrA [Canibacter zhoujuaniae]|uniref:MtrAB system response regulator MtrA n=1 Tax=Canibacter zhoujuaniae TaxID=2708343 RepID=UPI00142112A6|nr:MtrAB system response regulator MtrA [Canibacter zhoujuaniae]